MNIFFLVVVNSNPCRTGNGGCSHICIPKRGKQRTCRCTTGFKAEGEKACKPYEKFAIVSQLEIMRGYSLDGAGEAMTPVAGPGKMNICYYSVPLMDFPSEKF